MSCCIWIEVRASIESDSIGLVLTAGVKFDPPSQPRLPLTGDESGGLSNDLVVLNENTETVSESEDWSLS